ncbi:MAG: flagellar motor switch protein FliN [Gammaproteobacteria bacterium]|nr:flagellar motor switch protein FliN [Gammaproteobacteria bacterium]
MSDEEDMAVDDAAEDDWAAALQEQAETDGQDNSEVDALGIKAHQIEAFPEKGFGEEFGSKEDVKLDAILDIPVHISMEIGRTQISIRNLLKLNQGSVVELDRLAGEPMDVLVNGTLIARGEVVVVNEKFGLRLTDIVSPSERVKKLK